MREERIKQFKKMEKYKDSLNLEINKAEIFLLKKSPTLKFLKTNSPIFLNENVVDSISKFENPLVFVYGSAHKAGGGVLTGAKAQEEDLSLCTTWYFHVKDCFEYYKKEHTNLLYSDDILYVKRAYLLTDKYGFENEPLNISMIGAAAPNLSGMKKSLLEINESEIYSVFENRLENIFQFAEENNHNTFIAGAWGCGVFGLSPEKVANIYVKIINKKIYSGTIVFSIMDNEQYKIFSNIIGDLN